MILNKHQILAAADLRSSVVSVPEWGGDVAIRAMSVAQQIEFSRGMENKKEIDIMFDLLLFCCVDDAGNNLFDKDDLFELHKKSFECVEKVFKAICELNKVGPGEIEKEAKK